MNYSTIKGWLNARDNALANGQPIPEKNTLLMPVVSGWEHLCPESKAYLFSVTSTREKPYIIDRNNVSQRTRRGWRTTTSSRHIVFVNSIAVFKGRKMEWLRGPSDVVIKFVLPEGWRWENNNLGLCVVDPEEIDFHPTFTAEITVENILEGHAKNKEIRRKQLEDSREKKENEILFQENLNNIRVSLVDSRRAGNCVEGSLAFAERYLKIPREEVISNGYLLHVSARKLIDSGDNRAIMAVKQAWNRETLISI